LNSASNAPVDPFHVKPGAAAGRPSTGSGTGTTGRPATDAGSTASAAPAASAAHEESLQGPGLALARILGRIVTALDLLTGDDGRRALSASPGPEPTAETLHAVREELRLAREELTPLQGTGDALLSSAGRDAKAQQRTDPAHAPSFGG